ncbi:MAG: hypothetical protein R6V84_10595 [Desulfobacterales bacterium]
MRNTLKQWVQRHPYALTGTLFMAMVLVGWQELGWGERQLGFVLLIYFIVTLGIRLDEIARAIGGGVNLRAAAADPSDLFSQLQEIKVLLADIRSQLSHRERPGDAPGDPAPKVEP